MSSPARQRRRRRGDDGVRRRGENRGRDERDEETNSGESGAVVYQRVELNFGHILELFPSCRPTLADIMSA